MNIGSFVGKLCVPCLGSFCLFTTIVEVEVSNQYFNLIGGQLINMNIPPRKEEGRCKVSPHA